MSDKKKVTADDFIVTAETPVTDTEVEILIKSLEAIGKSRSIAQHWQLSALRELQVLRKNNQLIKEWANVWNQDMSFPQRAELQSVIGDF